MFANARVDDQGHVTHGDDKGLYVEFEMKSVLQPFDSEKEGRPIYKDVPYITIHFPGDKTKTVCRPVMFESNGVQPADTQRFKAQYEAFVSQSEVVEVGTPITEWAPLTKSEAMEFKGMKIHTVEQLAALPDTALSWLGARQRRDQAVAFLQQAKDGSAITKLMAEKDAMGADIAAMKQQIAELTKKPTKSETKGE